MRSLEGRVAAVTGGTRSIGRACAEAFLAAGAKVVVNGRSADKGRRALEEMGGGEDVAFFPGDMTTQAAAEGIVDFAVETFGQLDVLLLNSGGVVNSAPVQFMTDEEWRLEVDWNLNSVFWGMRRALQHMVPRGYGRVLVTSSIEGKVGKAGLPGYNATKHAVLGLVKSAAHETGTVGVTVNAILPGLVETDMVRESGPAAAETMGLPSYGAMLDVFAGKSAIKACNTVEQVAAVALMLAREEARNLTGCMFPVDGGTLPY